VNAKRLVSSVIIVALMVNFSFFLTGAVIDVGNIVGGFIYKTLTPEVVVTEDGVPVVDINGNTVTRGALLGETLTGALRTSTLFNEASTVNKNLTIYTMVLVFLMGAVFYFISGFVFLAAALMFITRTVVLMLVLILSPIAFVAAILPKTQGVWRRWVSALVGNAAVLPIFLILIAVVVLIAGDNSLFNEAVRGAESMRPGIIDAGNQNLTAIAINKGDVGGGEPTTILSYSAVMVNFMIIIGLMIAALKISQAAAGQAGAAVAKVGGRIAGGGLTAGAYAGRKVIGGAARKVIENERFNKWAGDSKIGRHLESGLNKTASGSFDFRNIKGVGEIIAKETGFGLGKGGGKGGNLAIQERKRKRYEGQEKRLEGRAKLPSDLESRELGQVKADRKKKLERPRKELGAAEKEYRAALKKTDTAAQDSARLVWLRAQDSLREAEKAFSEDSVNEYGNVITEGEKTRITRLSGTGSRRGQQTKEAYADTLDRRVGTQVRGRAVPLWYVSKARQDTADKLRKGTTKRERVLSAVKDYSDEQDDQTATTST